MYSQTVTQFARGVEIGIIAALNNANYGGGMADDDLSAAGKAGGVAGWDGTERRQRDRRERDADADAERRQTDRRRAQYCHVCGKTFKPTAMQKRICPSCRSSAMRMGAPTGRWGGV